MVQWPQTGRDHARCPRLDLGHCVESIGSFGTKCARVLVFTFCSGDILEGRALNIAAKGKIMLHRDKVVVIFPNEEYKLRKVTHAIVLVWHDVVVLDSRD
jgi:hypothetical protein